MTVFIEKNGYFSVGWRWWGCNSISTRRRKQFQTVGKRQCNFAGTVARAADDKAVFTTFDLYFIAAFILEFAAVQPDGVILFAAHVDRQAEFFFSISSKLDDCHKVSGAA